MSPPDPLYVLLASSPYSGSTLLSFLLGDHPEVSTTSDVSGTRRSDSMASFRCSCGKLMRECDFWLQVRQEMRMSSYPDFELDDFRTSFDLGDTGLSKRLRVGSMRWSMLEHARDEVLAKASPAQTQALVEVGARTEAFANSVMGITGTHVFLDASKERLRARYLARYLQMDVRVIHLVRDPRGVVDSALRRHADTGESIDAAARRWVSAQRTTLRILEEVPEPSWIRVHYEDLCSDVTGVLERLHEFCLVSPDRRLGGSRSEQHLLGNKMRLRAVDEVRLDERWKTSLSEAQQRRVVRIAGSMMERLDQDRAATRSISG